MAWFVYVLVEEAIVVGGGAYRFAERVSSNRDQDEERSALGFVNYILPHDGVPLQGPFGSLSRAAGLGGRRCVGAQS